MEFIKDIINLLAAPWYLITMAGVLLFVSFRYREILYTNKAALILFPGMAVFLAISMLDDDFYLIVTKPDNVPIVGMLFLIPFFTWYAIREGVRNDKRLAEGKSLVEKEETADKVLTWPDLVYTELICMVVLTFVLIGWSILIAAPIEEPANPANTPNPSKAPWYFLGTAGNARLFRSVARRSRFSQPHRRGVDGDSVFRHESERQRLLHV